MRPPRASSTKTRIETRNWFSQTLQNAQLRGRVPQKQGLKPHIWHGVNSAGRPPRASSTKTRIETEEALSIIAGVAVLRGRVPQKQGLKRILESRCILVCDLRGRVPQKQGLKHLYLWIMAYPTLTPRASSTQTRIETYESFTSSRSVSSSEGEFHKNKD